MEAMRRRYGTWALALKLVALMAFAAFIISDGMAPSPVYGATITVDTTADNLTAGDGDCTLREAITNANANADTTSGDCIAGGGTDTIDFSGDLTISPTSALPDITDPVIIDGTSFAVTLDGTNAGSADGLRILSGGGGSTVKGLTITDFGGHGVEIFSSAGNTIGGTTVAERNVISGNTNLSGVQIANAASTANVVQGNFIGTNAAGTSADANAIGVNIVGSSGNTVGGAVSGEGNVISGNTNLGVGIFSNVSSNPANNNIVKGNLIGTQADGTSTLGNSSHGVRIVVFHSGNANGNAIGGTGANEGNTIAFNGGDGVRVEYSGDGTGTATGNAIRGNSIHTNTGAGINNVTGGNTELAAPTVDAAGSASGSACAGCTVDVYSDDADEGRSYEGSTVADGGGAWSFSGPVTGPNVTATATDASDNTSEFSVPFVADTDGDGFTDTMEVFLGTDPALACPLTSTANDEEPDGWPYDLDDNQWVNILDIIQLAPPAFNSETGDPDYSQRKDFDGNGWINILDIIKMTPPVFNSYCAP